MGNVEVSESSMNTMNESETAALNVTSDAAAADAMLATLIHPGEAYRVSLFIAYSLDAIIAVLGIAANILNIVVFAHQGFQDTINVSLTTLALADLASLVFLIWISICHMPQFIAYAWSSLSFNSLEVSLLTGGYLRITFTLLGGWITAVIAANRCFCVLRPFAVRTVVTSRRLVVLNIAIFTVVVAACFTLYRSAWLGWKHDVTGNSSYVGLMVTDDRDRLEQNAATASVVMSSLSFLIVCTCTVVINAAVVKQTKWRLQMAVESGQNHTSAIGSNNVISTITIDAIAITTLGNGNPAMTQNCAITGFADDIIPPDTTTTQCSVSAQGYQPTTFGEVTLLTGNADILALRGVNSTGTGDNSTQSDLSSVTKGHILVRKGKNDAIGTTRNKKVSKNGGLSTRDAKTTKMVLLIAAVFIVSNLPSTVNRLWMAFFPGYSKIGHYDNLFEICWALTFMAEAIGSGANFFMYLAISSKFRLTFKWLFPRCFSKPSSD